MFWAVCSTGMIAASADNRDLPLIEWNSASPDYLQAGVGTESQPAFLRGVLSSLDATPEHKSCYDDGTPIGEFSGLGLTSSLDEV